jgi:hypothetical protein
VCGRKIPLNQIAGQCSNCYKKLCSRCAVDYKGRLYCVDCDPTPPPPPPPPTSSSGCFIATAAYGTPLANEVQVLRNFRDWTLMHSISGRVLTRIYYFISPSIAYFIYGSDVLRKSTRLLINPLVRFFRRMGY